MKLSDYVAHFLAKEGIRHVFAVSGGASVHLIQSVADQPGLSFICPLHEQAGAMAADAYSRVTGNLGAAISTSGPGATNLLTGVACAYYDSVPVIYITGQVATFRSRAGTGVRQIGFQETDTIDIFKHVTKYAVRVDDPKLIRRELEKACYFARELRPGPVLIDIPDNVQREEINPDHLSGFTGEPSPSVTGLQQEMPELLNLIANAQRPVLIVGWGLRLSKAEKEFPEFIDQIGFPVVPTWAAADILPSDHPLAVGTFGTHGTRYANFAVQNADLILSIGSRLDTKATGSPASTFARGAKKIVVDIDHTELGKFQKFGLHVDFPIKADVSEFLRVLIPQLKNLKRRSIENWINQISHWKNKYPICLPEYLLEEGVNPYVFVKTLSQNASPGDVFMVDTGCTLAWMMQTFEFKTGQRLFHDWNNTAMGWALPASIAASLAMDRKPVVCVTGDGSLLMNVQELATVVHHNLPIKIFLISNQGYSMIRQTQDQWLCSRFLASSMEGGLPIPDFGKVAEAFGLQVYSLSLNRDLTNGIQEVMRQAGPTFCIVEISPNHRVIPQVKFGRPNEDLDPLLPRSHFLEDMIIPPLEVSIREG
ncbi:MAG TPA: thiamine pyrophosphate-binding protein [Deltaproteobacteria bacterium]|jgi:acetolactate synthase-1/2/3 large subunit|nr:thiamine pyrophosphate-binding protein [Deltaproteobacteria bacterium]